jgi:hypothetical protein
VQQALTEHWSRLKVKNNIIGYFLAHVFCFICST